MATNEQKKNRIDKAASFTKGVLTIAVPLGVGALSKNFTALVKPPVDASRVSKIVFGIGEYFVAGMLSHEASKYAENSVDEIGNSVKELIDKSDGISTDEDEDKING